MSAQRRRPNILVAGTPGTGKTTLSEAISERLGLQYVNVGTIIQEKGFHAGRDEVFDSYVLDEAAEDKLLDELEPLMSQGGVVVEFHSVDFFPERWFDIVLVLRTETRELFDRLTARGYSSKKVEENITAEIMQVVLEEARESYPQEIVHELPSGTVDDMESNVARIVTWADHWQSNNSSPT